MWQDNASFTRGINSTRCVCGKRRTGVPTTSSKNHARRTCRAGMLEGRDVSGLCIPIDPRLLRCPFTNVTVVKSLGLRHRGKRRRELFRALPEVEILLGVLVLTMARGGGEENGLGTPRNEESKLAGGSQESGREGVTCIPEGVLRTHTFPHSWGEHGSPSAACHCFPNLLKF